MLVKASEGVGFKDSKFENFWSTSIANGVWATHAYHYARPDLNPGATGAANEAKWFASVVSAVGMGPQDILMLDFEQNESAAWAHAFYNTLSTAITLRNKPVLYDSVSHFNQFFAGDLALAAKYDCALASWHPISQGPPPVPRGWRMLWWQYSDRENVPGIGLCDANLWLGETKGEHAGMLLQHPLIIGQQDIVFLGTDGHVHLSGNHNDGMAGLVKDSAETNIDLGAPLQEPNNQSRGRVFQ